MVLFDLLENHIINNLVDYVTGVEVGLDSNGRKSRSGDLMENLVESFIIKAGFIKNTNYFKEISSIALKIALLSVSRYDIRSNILSEKPARRNTSFSGI